MKKGLESHKSFYVFAIKSLCILSQTPDLQNLMSAVLHVMARNSLALLAHANASKKEFSMRLVYVVQLCQTLEVQMEI